MSEEARTPSVSSSIAAIAESAATLLCRWQAFSEQDWYSIPGHAGLGCYGTGYNHWGVQTNQKYVAAMAALATLPEGLCVELTPEWRLRALERALAALRFSLQSHATGQLHCTDGTRWGHTWIASLGIERMMCGVHRLSAHLLIEDREAIDRVLTSEANWIIHHYHRNGHKGVRSGLWHHAGDNVPDSNLWNGAALWRCAERAPLHPDAAVWRSKAHSFLVNSVSIPADAHDERLVAGRQIRDWFRGANFFPNFALDHHGYMNVGTMLLCISQAAILYFDMLQAGQRLPESLFHHQADLWRVLRRFIFSNGRLACIGGDSSARYACDQEYLMPALLFAAHCFGDEHALGLLRRQIEWVALEAEANADGSFFGKRCARLASQNPYYYAQIETDRACALAMTLCHINLIEHLSEAPICEKDELDTLELVVEGGWEDADHGDVAHRCSRRLASFAWRAYGLGQGLCLPPDCGHMAEWLQNLGGCIRFLGDHSPTAGGDTGARRLLGFHIRSFEGGFVTCGQIEEGVNLVAPDGWNGDTGVVHNIAFAALPDGRTVVGLEYAVNTARRSIVTELAGLRLNLPNDLFNGYSRRLATAHGETELKAPARSTKLTSLRSPWVCLDGRLGAVLLYGANDLVVGRNPARRGGHPGSLLVDEIGAPMLSGRVSFSPGQTILDIGWSILSDAGAEETQTFSERHSARRRLDGVAPGLRGALVTGADGIRYAVMMNIGIKDTIFARGALDLAAPLRALGEDTDGGSDKLVLPPGQARVYRMLEV